jgi:pimeloyl-ACP methyl ester carboxylesterase
MTAPAVWRSTAGQRNGLDVVLIHGSLDRSAGLLKLSRRLDESYRVTRYDRRGYGRSVPHTGPFDIEHQVSDLVEVLDAVAPAGQRSVLVGHSYGGNVALACADRHPDRVLAVATFESPVSWEPWWPGGSAGGDAMKWRDDPEEAAERFMRRLIGDERWERLPASTRRSRRREGPAMIGELTDLRQQAPWSAARVSAPTLVMFGEHGQPHHRAGSEWLTDRLPHAELHMVADARHFGPNTHPDVVGGILTSFIERVRNGVRSS